jgi:hypothetical protein
MISGVVLENRMEFGMWHAADYGQRSHLSANSIVGRMNHLDALNLAQLNALGKALVGIEARRAGGGSVNGAGRQIANEFAPTNRE